MQSRTRVFLILAVAFTTIYSSAAFYSLASRPEQPFMGIGIFSNQGTLSNYIPGSGLGVRANETMSWRVQVMNRMGAIQYVRLVYRLGNLTTTNPSSSLPADAIPQIGLSELFIANQETAMLNFTWRIASVNQTSTTRLKLELNGNTPTWTAVGSSTLRDFRMIFELWTYDPAAGFFRYGWRNGDFFVGEFLQIWFDYSP